MKTTYGYSVDYWVKGKNEDDEPRFSGTVTGITNSKDILASAFRQHSEMLPAVKVKLSYYEI